MWANPRAAMGRLGAVVAYLALFYLFDTQATFFETAPGVSLWYPSAGLNLAFLVIFGIGYAPVVLFALIGSGLWIADPPLPLGQLVLPNLVIVAAYGVAAMWLRRQWRRELLSYLRPIAQLVAVALILPVLVAVFSVASYTLTSMEGYTWEVFWGTVLSWWLGDAVGILTITPFLFVALAPWLQFWRMDGRVREALWLRLHQTPQALLQVALEIVAIALALDLAFYVAPDDTLHLYFCFLPVLWMALRNGIARATLGILLVNAGAMIVLHEHGAAPIATNFQLFMITLSLTGLFLGGLISERGRAMHALKEARDSLERRVEERTAQLRAVNEELSIEIQERRRAEASLQRHVVELQENREVLERNTRDLAVLNRKLSRSEQQLKELNASKDTFFSIISHDLRSPFSVVLGISRLLSDDATAMPRSEVREFSANLHQAARRVYTLLENLLEWARLHSGRMPFHPEPLRLHGVVEETADLLLPNAAAKDIEVVLDVPKALVVTADAHMLQAVLRNLLSNAIKFTPAGGRVTVEATGTDEEVVISVQDSGVGLSQEAQRELFRIDARSRSAGTAHEEGSGLGLILCKEMVERHGGRINVESTLGEGACFQFTMPVSVTTPDLALQA